MPKRDLSAVKNETNLDISCPSSLNVLIRRGEDQRSQLDRSQSAPLLTLNGTIMTTLSLSYLIFDTYYSSIVANKVFMLTVRDQNIPDERELTYYAH